MEFLSCVSNTALPVLGLTTLAIDKSICGYNTLLSALEPLLLPKGKSEINTSTELSVKKNSESSQLIVPFRSSARGLTGEKKSTKTKQVGNSKIRYIANLVRH